ncbi:MAG: carboxypeptidase regulatory-like domain-containing protein [Planctomycetota bacterium]
MNKLLAVVSVLLLVGLLAWGFQLLQPGESGGSSPIDVSSGTEGESGEPLAEVESSKQDQPEPESGEPETARRQDLDRDLPQSVSGRVVSSTGGVLPGAKVYLLKDVSTQETIQWLIRNAANRGRPAAIRAEDETDSAGRFHLGAEATQGEAGYQLHVAAKNHVVDTRKLRLSPNERQDVGTIVLQRGKTLRGTVVDAMTKRPIENATLWLKATSATGFMLPTPGFEDGQEVRTDAHGRYQVSGLAQETPLTLKALAKGYGTVLRNDIMIPKDKDALTENIELPQGFEIEGWVINSQGDPIPGARLEAIPYSEAHPTPGKAYSNEDGFFSILGLAEGQYTVTAEARGYIKRDWKAQQVGSKDLRLVLEKQGSVIVTVRRKDGRRVPAYRLEVKAYFEAQGEGQETYGRTGIAPVEVRGAKRGTYELSGLDPRRYVLEVHAINLAKTYSQPFTIAEGQTEPVRVEVVMNEGGRLSGRVVDESGKGVAGVSIQDNPVTRLFLPLIPVKITTRSTVTDSQGRFRMALLTPGKYQLKFEHKDYTRVYKKGFDVQEGRVLDIGPVKLPQGGRLSGTVFYKGLPVSQAEVTVTSTDTGTAGAVFEKVHTDKDGKFVVPRPLPEGEYSVQARRTNVGNPLLGMVDLQKSKKTVSVFPGRMQRITIPIPHQ